MDLQIKEESKGRDHQTQGSVGGQRILSEEGYRLIALAAPEEVFALVVRFETIRALIALAALKRWMIRHLDVKSAFLNGEIEEVIYVQQPKGFAIEGKEDHVLGLRKALYGLK